MCNWLIGCASLISAISTGVLAVITYYYMRETKAMRNIADLAFQLDVSPKVFISDMSPDIKLNSAEKKIEIATQCELKNVGKTEAKKIQASYLLSVDSVVAEQKSFKSCAKSKIAPSIFPSQAVSFRTEKIFVVLKEEYFEAARNQYDKEKRITFASETMPHIGLEVRIEFLDHNNSKQGVSYLCTYKWDSITWGMEVLS